MDKNKKLRGSFELIAEVKDSETQYSLPPELVERLMSRCKGQLVITLSATNGNCLWCYPMDKWPKVEKQVNNLSSRAEKHMRFKRAFLGQACEIEIIEGGIINIPEYLRDFANIKGNCFAVGRDNKYEIWSGPCIPNCVTAIKGLNIIR